MIVPIKDSWKTDSEQEAREFCVKSLPACDVQIILSRGKYYIECTDNGMMIRTWERIIYTGLGKKAL